MGQNPTTNAEPARHRLFMLIFSRFVQSWRCKSDKDEEMIQDCSDIYNVTSEWGTGLKATISMKVPTAISTWNVTLYFNNNVNGIRVKNGKNEECHNQGYS